MTWRLVEPRHAALLWRTVLWSTVLWASLAFSIAPCRAAEEETLLDDWHCVYIMGKKAGYEHQRIARRTQDGQTTIQTRSETHVSIARAGVRLEFGVELTVDEDPEGRLMAFERTMRQGALAQVSAGVVEGDELVLLSGQGGNASTKRIRAPQGLCPWALHRLTKEKGYEPGTTYTVEAFVPDFPGRKVEATMTVVGEEAVQVFEVTKWLHRVDTKLSILPAFPASQWVDDAGTVWLTRAAAGPGLSIEMRKATKEIAMAPGEPAELLLTTLVHTDVPIARPRELERLKVLLLPVEGVTTGLQVAAGPYQEAQKVADGLMVTVTRAHGAPAGSYRLPYADQEYADLLRPNRWLETEDPLITQMAREAVGEETDALRAARLIERYVHEAITEKNLGFGMATAAETAKQKAGDCTEHAVLAAALARAAGMPGRVVAGITYTDGVPGREGGAFAYHMWTEVYVGEWLPIDAALGGHDATHIALARSSLNGPGEPLEIASAVVGFVGKVRAQIVEASGPGNEAVAD